MQSVQRGICQIFANTMDVLVVFYTPSKDLKNLCYTISVASIFLESTQTS
jgi:hypothetical protein